MRRWSLLPLVTLAALAALPACQDESVGQPREFQTAPYGVAACDTPNGQFNLRRELRLYANPGLDVEGTAAALQRYYRRFGITFFRIQPVQFVTTPYVEDSDAASLTAALRKEFPGVDFSDAALQTLSKSDPALFDRIIRKLLNLEFQGAWDFFMGQGGSAGQGVTNVVLLRDLFSPGSPKLERENVLGISLSKILIRELKRSGMDMAGAFQMLEFPPEFTPVVFISDPNVRFLESRAGAVHRDLVLGHEFGHSTGLVHRMDKTNLMNPSTDGTEKCDLKITDDQIAIMREGLGVTPATAGQLLSAESSDPLAPLVPPAILAGIMRGDDKALRTLLGPLHGPLGE